jgi:predicted O-methyltransferase YrrM
VRAFLESRRGDWHDLNVSHADGQALHDLIVSRGFRRGLEIGTSTGHSTVWIAWAMSRTGGHLTTLEIDPGRHRVALENLAAAGLDGYVDAELADAHERVPLLEGRFDFVFSDADKEWYTRYFVELDSRLEPGGCFTAHNVLQRMRGIPEFLEHVRGRTDYETRIERSSAAGISVSCKIP